MRDVLAVLALLLLVSLFAVLTIHTNHRHAERSMERQLQHGWQSGEKCRVKLWEPYNNKAECVVIDDECFCRKPEE